MASSGPEKADCSQIISSTSPGGVPGDSGGSSTRPTLKITLLGSEWNSSAGGLSTFNRELAIHLSEHPQVDVTLLVPEGACKDEEKNEARRYGVNVVDAKFQAGFDPLYWLSCPPKDLHIDIVIGHGIKLGPQVQIIRNCVQFSTCKWVQVVHTAPEDLSKFKNYSDPTSKGETKYQVEIDLCKRADLVVPVGPRLTNSYSGKLRRWKKETDIFTFTPGLFQREFGDLEQVANNNEDFKVLIVGRGDTEDFELKGLDIAAKAFADKRLKHKPYELTFVGAPEGKQEEVRDRLLQCGIAKEQLTVRRFVQSRDRMKDLLCEADLAIMPSKSEGFGLVAAEALSAGLPILVSKRSGFAKAIDVVPYGYLCVVDSYDPAEWAKAIDAVRSRHAMRLKEILAVKASYGEMYSWKEQCEALVERMWQMVQGNESMNMRQKSDTPDEKHEEACRTSEQRQPFEKREKTLGTNEAESSPKKEPLENWWPSLSESTSDPGNENMNMRQKCDTPAEKLEEACRTSEQRHPFEKREKTLGTNEAESSPKKEPLENWWPSLSGSTPDPESSKGSLAEGESKNGDAICPVISTNDGKSSRDGKPDQSESANGVEAKLGGSGAGSIKKTDPYEGTGAIPKRPKQGNSRKPETSISKDPWAEETGETEILPVQETSNVLSKCDFRLEKHEAAAKTSVQNPVCNQKRTALGRNEDKTSSSTKLSTNRCKPSMSGSTAPDQVSTVSGKMPTFAKKKPIETMDEMKSGVKEEITRRKRTPDSSAGQVYGETVGCSKHCGSASTSQSARTSPQSTTSHKYRASKGIDEMNLREITKLMDVLGVTDEGVKTLGEAKERIRKEIQLAEKTFNGWSSSEAFSVLSEAKEEDARKRRLLLDFYTKAEAFLGRMDERMITLLQKHSDHVKENMKLHIKQLKKTEDFLIVAGETSSGKSSLINLILGEEILPYSLLSTTSTICELKFGEERRLVVHFKDKDPETGLKTKEILLEQPEGSSDQSFLDQISPYIHVKTDREKGSIVKKIELFWPHNVLEAGLVIIDSPGVGESEEMDDMVIQYLPEAFAFMYVINSSNAGGIQKDRLEKLLKRARSVLIGDPKEGKEEGRVSLGIQEHLLSKCALFVCNKWDVVQEQEVQSVKNDVVEKLERAWSGIDPESQIIYMSTKRATTAQNLGVISKDFSSLMEGMRSVILQSIEAKLELHWNWLNTLLSRIVVQAKMFVVNASRSNEEINQKMKEINHRLEAIGKDQKKVIKYLHGSFNEKVNGVVQQLGEYLSSEEVIEEFTFRSSDKFPDLDEEMSWKEVEEEITTVLSSQFQEIVERWEEENRVFANAGRFLMQKFQDCYDGVESELQNLQSDATGVHGGAGISEKKTFRFHFSIARKAFMKMGSVTVGALSYIAEAIDDVFDSGLSENLFGPDFETLWAKTSTNFLATRRKNKELRKFVQDKLRDAKLYLDRIEECLPELIEANRELYKQLSRKLLEETRSKEKTKDRYEPILVKGSQLRDQLALFGVTDVCVVKIDREELDWKEEMSSHLGSGAFAAVYKGTMRRREEVTTVALKVCKEALNADNASEIMQEMKILRVLNHPHIVQFYGISLVPSTSRMIFVMEKCKDNLKNYIFRELQSAAGRSENRAMFGDLCRYAKQITDGLAFIHAIKVVHRDLKLENILLSEENTVKIGGMGLAIAEIDITGTFAGTPIYLAPEVRHSRVYDSKADIYSLGLIMWEMWYGQRVFADAPGTTFQDFFDWVDEGNRPVHKQGCKTPPSFWEQLMKQCWDGNPNKRPTAKKCNEIMAVFVTESETSV